jgi:hypothetical protein
MLYCISWHSIFSASIQYLKGHSHAIFDPRFVSLNCNLGSPDSWTKTVLHIDSNSRRYSTTKIDSALCPYNSLPYNSPPYNSSPYSSPPYNSPPLHLATLQLATITSRHPYISPPLHLATITFCHHYISPVQNYYFYIYKYYIIKMK